MHTGTAGTGMDVCTGPGTGTTSIPVPYTFVISVQHQPGTRHLGKFGTSITVPTLR